MGIDSNLGQPGLKPGICTSLTRPASPYVGMEIFETDTMRAMKYTTSWVPFGLHNCTSTTRPTGVNGLEIYETDTFRTLLYDGTGWVIMNEPMITSFSPVITASSGTLTTVSAVSDYYRSNGWVNMKAVLSFTNIGSGAGSILITLPIASNGSRSAIHFGSGWVNVTNKTVNGIIASPWTQAIIYNYDGSFPVASGQTLWITLIYPMTTRYS